MPCIGDSNTKCGGFNRMNVYQMSYPSNGQCYEDNKDGKRLFKSQYEIDLSPTLSFKNSPKMYDLQNSFFFVKGHHKLPNLCFRCLSICQGHDKGYIYYGLQNGNQCWCGKEMPDAKFHKDNAECDKPCPGESNTKCGGHNRMNVYQIPSDPAGACYISNLFSFQRI